MKGSAMAQSPTPRRFYIDHADDRPVVRTVPVKRAVVSKPETAIESPATHQVSIGTEPDRSIAMLARRVPKAAMSTLVRSARKHTRHA